MALNLPPQFNSLESLTRDEAIITRSFLAMMGGEPYQPLKPLIARVIRYTGLDGDDVIHFRRQLTNKYRLMESRRKTKADGVPDEDGVWLSQLTDHGEDFLGWINRNPEWGTEDHPVVKRAVDEASSEWTLGELGVVIADRIPFTLWRQVSKKAKALGYRTVLVPPEGKVYLGVMKDGKPKAVAIPTWEELNGRGSEDVADEKDREIERLRKLLEEKGGEA